MRARNANHAAAAPAASAIAHQGITAGGRGYQTARAKTQRQGAKFSRQKLIVRTRRSARRIG